MSLDELIENLKTYEMRKLELRKEEPKRDKAQVPMSTDGSESHNDNFDIARFTKKFKTFMKNPRNNLRRKNLTKTKHVDKASYDGCYKCKKMYDMIKNYPIWDIELKNKRYEKDKNDMLKEHSPNRNKNQEKSLNEAMNEAFQAAYEDSVNEEEN